MLLVMRVLSIVPLNFKVRFLNLIDRTCASTDYDHVLLIFSRNLGPHRYHVNYWCSILLCVH